MDLIDNPYYRNVILHHEVVIHSESFYSAATVNTQTSADFLNINVCIFCPYVNIHRKLYRLQKFYHSHYEVKIIVRLYT